jgi:hypothetical protein
MRGLCGIRRLLPMRAGARHSYSFMPLQRETESRFEKRAWQELTLKRPEGRAPPNWDAALASKEE